MENLAMRVSSKIEEGDVRGAVRLAVSDESLAPYDETTVVALRLLHPMRATPGATSSSQPSDKVSPETALKLT